jgi:DNA-binding NtrC family response regulator
MSPTTQAQLLRVLETGEVTRVGSHRSRKVDVRVVSATNRDLRRMIGRGQFRADLYFRLNGVSLQIPPLRDRPDDILPLAEHFAERCARHLGAPRPVFSDGAQGALRRYRWPGNVRELKHVIERAIVLCSDGVLGADLLQLEGAFGREPLTTFPPDSGYSSENMRVADRVPEGRRMESAPPSRGMFDPPRSQEPPRSPRDQAIAASQRAEQLRAELARAERDRILDALRRSGTQAEAAKLLGISRRALIYRLEAYGIPRPRKDKFKF